MRCRQPWQFCKLIVGNTALVAADWFAARLQADPLYESHNMFGRIALFLLTAPLLGGCATTKWDISQAPKNRPDGLVTAAPNVGPEQAATLTALVTDAAAGKWGSVDSLLIMKDDKLVLETYFRGNQWDQPHDLRSVTKSLLSAAYGAGISHKLITSEAQPVYELFEKTSQFSNPHPEKALITAAHVMSMTAGLRCGDMGSATNPCGARLHASATPWRSKLQVPPWQRALNLPLEHRPGTVFTYNDAAPVIMDAMISGIVGVETNEFLKLTLFRPMDFNPRSNLHRLTARDMAKFGQLYLNGGIWNGKRLLLRSWIETSTSMQWTFPDTDSKKGYGYFWWISDVDINGVGHKMFCALGNGGQAIFVVPSQRLVFVTTAANYDDATRQNAPIQMLKQYVIPAFAISPLSDTTFAPAPN